MLILPFVSQFQTPQEALDVVVFDDGLKRVYLRDIATVKPGYKKENVSVLHNGTQVVVIGVRKEPGANVLAMTDLLEQEVNRLNKGVLAENDLYIDWVYDR